MGFVPDSLKAVTQPRILRKTIAVTCTQKVFIRLYFPHTRYLWWQIFKQANLTLFSFM